MFLINSGAGMGMGVFSDSGPVVVSFQSASSSFLGGKFLGLDSLPSWDCGAD